MISNYIKKLLFIVVATLGSNTAFADTPITLFESHAGNVNFVGAQKTRRTQSNSGNTCAVLGANTTNTLSISGIPSGATIKSAQLYWAGSNRNASGFNPDYNVIFEGTSITADRQFTADFDSSEQYFSGAEDVTSIVQSRANPNGSYSFSGLTVYTGNPHCSFSTVTAGWSLVIIYEHTSEDFRVVNLFDGFELIYGSSVTLTLNNFKIPASPINGKHAYITWEGDAANSAPRNGVNESLRFKGTFLSSANNPINNIYNSISNINGVDTNSYGVDFDVFSIDSLLSVGDTSATSIYSSGGDQVHLSMEIISVTNTPVSDLGVTKAASSAFNVGSNATYAITVNNAGPNVEPGNIVVTDTLPAGLSYVSATGTGWSCSAAGQNVTCTRTGSLAVGASTSTISLTVAVTAAALPSINNTATVTGTNFDNISANNNSTATTPINSAPSITLQKTSQTISDPVNGASNPKAIPGALAEYSIKATNSGLTATDNNTTIITDAIPPNTALYVNDISGVAQAPSDL